MAGAPTLVADPERICHGAQRWMGVPYMRRRVWRKLHAEHRTQRWPRRPFADVIGSETINEMKTKMTTLDGAQLIATERNRVIQKEGWTPEHDDTHTEQQLAIAAAAYAIPAEHRDGWLDAGMWPFEVEWWKPCPEDRIKELVKAGQFIAAEIDRLQRLKAKSQNDQS